MDIRPRTLGEILDDAWRLALADAPLLLLFNSVFMVPALTVVLLLLAEPVSSGIFQVVLPALAALLLPLTGLASGTCQHLLRQRLAGPQRRQGQPVLALWAGMKHAAARALVLCGTLPGPLLLLISLLPDTSSMTRFLSFLFGLLGTSVFTLPLWGACLSLHVLLSASANRSGGLVRELLRDAAAAPGRAAVLVLSRLALLLFLAVQLHLLMKVVLWIADNLGGFDTSLMDVQLALFTNPLYTLALFLLCWLMLAPFFECCNFLLHTDIRTRQEGLDLQYRVQRAFAGIPTEPRPSGSGSPPRPLTFAGLILLLGGWAHAEETRQETIHAIRRDIAAIRSEIQKVEPYPGGQRWQGRLSGMQARLARIQGGGANRFRWFEQAITDLKDRKKEDALRTLDDLDRRLALLEDALTPPNQPVAQAREKRSPEDIKSLLRGSEGRKVERTKTRQRVEEDRPQVRREEEHGKEPAVEAPRAGGGRAAPVSVPAARGGGFSSFGWLLVGGMALAVVAVALFLYLIAPRSPKPESRKPSAPSAGSVPDNDAQQVLDESPEALWRQADTLAADGRCREAIRTLYLGVLALLHRKRFIRFEPTRTNGEYVRQVRLSEQAPPELHEPFQQLTQMFESAWYGERSCEPSDYRSCRRVAEMVQQMVVRA